ncbi:Neuroglian [Armadillidium vulgare]|nr:Neuroglian [Armadillidium vulgare]
MSKTQIHSMWKLERCMVVLTLVLLSGLILPSAAIVKYPPRMVKQPLPNEELLFQVARGGGEAENEKPFTIECEAQGSPPPNRNLRFFFCHSLVGQYQCFATNELGVATSNSVFVRKYEFNSFKDEDPQTIIADEGQPASLTCQPPQIYPKPTYLKGAVHNISSERVTVDPEGTLWFSNITKDDKSHDFTYTCATMSTFRNEYKLGSRVFLKVNQLDNSVTEFKNEPMKQFVSRKNTIILKGRNLQLWCIFSGTPLPQIKWIKKNGVLPLDRVVYENYGKRLVIKNADFDDEGTYECEAENGIGTTQSYTMNVEVQVMEVKLKK